VVSFSENSMSCALRDPSERGRMPSAPKPSVHLVSLGCAKNLVDSEVMLGTLLKHGYPLEADPSRAEVVVVNTCGFIQKAREEAVDVILRAALKRTRRPGQKLIVAGCLAQRYASSLAREMPEVDAFIGLNEVPLIHRVIESVVSGSLEGHARNLVSRRPSYLYGHATPRLQLSNRAYAYLKIGDGCDHRCAYCSIPAIRGRFRSRSLEDVVAEARTLVRQGVRELILISQDTTAYGRDLGLTHGLSRLLPRLDSLKGDFWIRVLYTHPASWNDRLIRTMAELPKVCRYIEMPLQHVDDDILRRMGRQTSRARIEELLDGFRSRIPGVVIRTTFIVGFPGETEAHFESLLDFVRTARFEHVGGFEYSREEGTRAAGMRGQVPDMVKRERFRRLMLVQRKITAAWRAGWVGETCRILVEKAGRHFKGRTEWDAPEIDGGVILRGGGWKDGRFQSVRITGARVYDWVGTAIRTADGSGNVFSVTGKR
jgi:ribosomal protein S12 methylthiotransferase